MELNRRNSQASALRRLRVVMRKQSRAALDGKPASLWPTEFEDIVHLCKIETSRGRVISPVPTSNMRRNVGAPESLDEFHRWMARDVYWRRDCGAMVKAANSEVAEVWQVSGTTVANVVREYGADAQDWLKKYGEDRESTAVLIAQRAQVFRMLSICRPTKFQAKIILYLYTVLSLLHGSATEGQTYSHPIRPKAPP